MSEKNKNDFENQDNKLNDLDLEQSKKTDNFKLDIDGLNQNLNDNSKQLTMEFSKVNAKQDIDEDYEFEKKKKALKEVKKTKRYLILTIIISLSVILSVVLLIAANDFLAFSRQDKQVQIEIPENSKLGDVSKILKDNGIIEYPIFFNVFGNITNYDKKISSGRYNLSTTMAYNDIISILKNSSNVLEIVKVTFPEGYNINQMAKVLEEKEVCTAQDFIDYVNKSEFGFAFEKHITNSPLKFYRLEGFLFPDTYEFYKGEQLSSITKKILNNFNNKITKDMYARMEQLGMTLQETITLASIIQAEAPDVENMKKVSSVFHNRLKNASAFPKLQSDPTKNYSERIIAPNSSVVNQEMIDEYNTYVGAGLPPGPIDNPGLDAINAALYPNDTNYLYFCSNLKTKEFFYATTLPQHNANLKKAGLK